MISTGATTIVIGAHIASATGTRIAAGSSVAMVGAYTIMLSTMRGLIVGTTMRRSATMMSLMVSAVIVITHSVAMAERHAVIGTHITVSAVVPTHSAIAHINRGAAEVIIASAIVVEHRVIPC